MRKDKSFTIAWLYPDLMNTYGDRGNIICLKKRCEWRDIECEINELEVGFSEKELEKADFIFMGGAQDQQQQIVAKDLFKKSKTLKNVIENGVPGLYICGAYQFLGKYYFFFAANDIQNDQQYGGIGVAIASKPEGPFTDAIGKPLIDKFHNKAQPIDPHVFIDDNGQAYLFYGGWGHCNVAKLDKNLTGFIPFEDGTLFKEITPEKYVEGPCMIKRKGKYYFTWAEGGWTGPDYSVAYAIADSPLGPFKRVDKILKQDLNHHHHVSHPHLLQHY